MIKVIRDIWEKLKRYFRRSPSLKEIVLEYEDKDIKLTKTHIEILFKREPIEVMLVRK